MTFLQSVSVLPARLVHHTGSMLRFTTGQLPHLPVQDTDCVLVLPDGAQVPGHFRRHPANPYVGGRALVAWIKSWVPYNMPIDVVVSQLGTGNRIHIAIGAGRSRLTSRTHHQQRIETTARRLRRLDGADRRRRAYAAWERNPNLRAVALAAWGPTCQVVGCSTLSNVPSHLRDHLVDVHHLNHVSRGGSDSPMNISVLCVTHHGLIHRAPASKLLTWDLDGAAVAVNGLTLFVQRDARLILQ